MGFILRQNPSATKPVKLDKIQWWKRHRKDIPISQQNFQKSSFFYRKEGRALYREQVQNQARQIPWNLKAPPLLNALPSGLTRVLPSGPTGVVGPPARLCWARLAPKARGSPGSRPGSAAHALGFRQRLWPAEVPVMVSPSGTQEATLLISELPLGSFFSFLKD